MDIWRTNYTYLYPRPHNNEKQFKCQLRNPVFILENRFNFKNFCAAKSEEELYSSVQLIYDDQNPKKHKIEKKIRVYV